MKDPATKYLKVVSGQEVSLSPKGIVVKCCDGAVKIEVLKSGRIALYAENEIQVTVKGEINVDAKRMVKVLGGETINMQSVKGGSLCLDKDGNITITGIKARLN